MKNEDLTLAVIIPAFNRERFIRLAIDSVLAQTVPPSEIIVVDDGSTDGTVDAVREYGDQVALIQIENNGAGPSRPRNTGIQQAKADLLMFLDSDDFLETTAVERCLSVYQRQPDIGLVCGNYYTVAIGDNLLERRQPNDGSTVRGITKKESLGPNEFLIRSKVAYETYCRANYIKTPATTIPRNICLEVGGFDESLRTSNDYDFFVRVLSQFDMVYIDEPLHTIVYHTDNISGSNLLMEDRSEVCKNKIRVLDRELKKNNSPSMMRALKGSISQHLLDLAYSDRKAGRLHDAWCAYLKSLSYGRPRLTAITGMLKTALRVPNVLIASKTKPRTSRVPR